MEHSKNNKFTNRTCSKTDGLPLMGVILIGLGLVFLLDRLNIIPSEIRSYIITWQALLIFIGFINLFRKNSRFPGIILILVGSTFLIPEIIHIPFEAKQVIWPIVLIVIGVTIVFKAKKFKSPQLLKSHSDSYNDHEKINEVAIFGGGKRMITTQNLKGGKITAIFGGLEIDLTDATIIDDIAVIEVACIFGGVSFIVKPEWNVQLQVATILGGFDDKRKVYKQDHSENSKQLIIKGAAIFGGGEVKSY